MSALTNPDPAGAWFRSRFPGTCSRGGETFARGVTIRADGKGGWECWECVEEGGWPTFADNT